MLIKANTKMDSFELTNPVSTENRQHWIVVNLGNVMDPDRQINLFRDQIAF